MASSESHSQLLEKIRTDLQRGVTIPDALFDQIYPDEVSRHSATHWTPVQVAMMAAELLCEGEPTRILDIGSGCGKFCLVASLTSPGEYTGAERRHQLWSAATAAARSLESPCRFLNVDAFDLDWREYDGFYLFNPFYELHSSEIRLDRSLEGKGDPEYFTLVEATKVRLEALPEGTRVVTYHGFGGDFPADYELATRLSAGSDFLNLWVKGD